MASFIGMFKILRKFLQKACLKFCKEWKVQHLNWIRAGDDAKILSLDRIIPKGCLDNLNVRKEQLWPINLYLHLILEEGKRVRK